MGSGGSNGLWVGRHPSRATSDRAVAGYDSQGASRTAARSGQSDFVAPKRLRRAGAGRKRQSEADPELVQALEQLVVRVTREDSESPLRWTCKSTPTLAAELTAQGHPDSASTVRRLLQAADYSLQGTRKQREGTAHPDRNAQFEYINSLVRAFQEQVQPVISVDTKKKELVGDFHNGGRMAAQGRAGGSAGP